MERGLQAIPGIADAQGVRDARIEVNGTPILFVAADVKAVMRRANLPPVAGDSKRMYDETAQGRALLASENFALLRGYKLGDVIDIPSPRGVLHLPLAGIVTDYSDQEGSILMDRSLYRRYWNDDTLNIFRVYLTPGANEADVKRRILEKFGADRRLFVLTNRDVRGYILRHDLQAEIKLQRAESQAEDEPDSTNRNRFEPDGVPDLLAQPTHGLQNA